MSIRWGKAIAAGVVGAVAMTIVGAWLAPMVGLPAMNLASMLAMKMGNMLGAGWAAHLAIGAFLAVVYASFQKALPGPSAVRGALFSLAPWIALLVVVAPLAGMKEIYTPTMMVVVLVGHLVYGLVMGTCYGESRPAAVSKTSKKEERHAKSA